MYAILSRVDPEARVDRWYVCAVTKTLLDPVAVLCAWGSRHTAYQQTRVFAMPSRESAETRVRAIVKQKLKRGYHVVSSDGLEEMPALAAHDQNA
jgi:predicted DNA-binding WGR domain protein